MSGSSWSGSLGVYIEGSGCSIGSGIHFLHMHSHLLMPICICMLAHTQIQRWLELVQSTILIISHEEYRATIVLTPTGPTPSSVQIYDLLGVRVAHKSPRVSSREKEDAHTGGPEDVSPPSPPPQRDDEDGDAPAVSEAAAEEDGEVPPLQPSVEQPE